jgi:hypothetical protein
LVYSIGQIGHAACAKCDFLVNVCHLSFQAAYWNNTIFAHLSSQPLQAFTFNASTMRLYKAAEGHGAFDPTFRNFHAGAVH